MSRKRARKTHKNRSSFPVDEIAKALGYSRSEIIKSLAHLKELKLVELDGRPHKGGGKWKATGLGMATAAMLEAAPDTSPKDSENIL